MPIEVGLWWFFDGFTAVASWCFTAVVSCILLDLITVSPYRMLIKPFQMSADLSVFWSQRSSGDLHGRINLPFGDGLYIWANYNNSLAWIKAIKGDDFPYCDFQWARSELVIIYPDTCLIIATYLWHLMAIWMAGRWLFVWPRPLAPQSFSATFFRSLAETGFPKPQSKHVGKAFKQPVCLDGGVLCGPLRRTQMTLWIYSKWVCLKMLCTPKPYGFADHYPY